MTSSRTDQLLQNVARQISRATRFKGRKQCLTLIKMAGIHFSCETRCWLAESLWEWQLHSLPKSITSREFAYWIKEKQLRTYRKIKSHAFFMRIFWVICQICLILGHSMHETCRKWHLAQQIKEKLSHYWGMIVKNPSNSIKIELIKVLGVQNAISTTLRKEKYFNNLHQLLRSL